MSVDNEQDTPEMGGATTPFASIPWVPVRTRPGQRAGWLLLGVIGLVLVGAVVAYLCSTPAGLGANAATVEMEVSGMHCPLQCGLRVAGALETLPWVVPRSARANPKNGTVTVAVTSQAAVNPHDLRRVIEHAGFGLRSIRFAAPADNGASGAGAESPPVE